MKEQLALPLPTEASYSEADFFVSTCNENAWQALTQPDAWGNAYAFYLYGEQGSGKTHLAHIWANRVGARFLKYETFATQIDIILAQEHPCYVLESIASIRNETAFFHLLNAIREKKGKLLLTGEQASTLLEINLPDLRSRIFALPGEMLAIPDETALRVAVLKQFSDRQLRVSEEVVNFLLARMERSFSNARKWVEALDEIALQQGRNITIPLVRTVMEKE